MVGSRIVAQSSVFIMGVSAIESNKIEKVIVQKESKRVILSQLANMYGITEEMLFLDFPGYARPTAPTRILTADHNLLLAGAD